MPFQIVNADLTKIKCDAIINPTNPEVFLQGKRGNLDWSGVNAMLRAYGASEKFKVGDVQVTDGLGLPVKYIIHTIFPMQYYGGRLGGRVYSLEDPFSCYRTAWECAKLLQCKSIAIPLFSVLPQYYSNDKMLAVVFKTIKKILAEDKDVQIYLAHNYSECGDLVQDFFNYAYENCCENNHTSDDFLDCMFLEKRYFEPKYLCCCEMEYNYADIDSDRSEGFFACLTEFVKRCGMSEVACYKKANVSRQTWSKIVSLPYYCPSKQTIAAFAIALQLNLADTQKLMEEGGYSLSKSIIFDLIIRYCIEHDIYDTDKVDAILCDYGEKTLFSIE